MTPQGRVDSDDVMMGWDEIERVDGFAGLRAHAEANVLPVLRENELEAGKGQALKGRMTAIFTGSFAAFIVAFLLVQAILPDTWWGETLVFILFPILFFGSLLSGAFLFRRTLLRFLIEAKARFFLRGRALSILAERLGLTYVPSPGGTPGALKWVADQAWAPSELKDAARAFDDAGGLDEAVAAARGAGVMIESNVYVVGTPEQKERYQKMAAGQAQVEDGFHGRRTGIDFEMFEWVERVKDAPDIHHLVVVLEAPMTLHGVTQLKSRKASWPQDAGDARLEEVDLGPKAFGEVYRLRASDQVEARAIFNPAVIERVIALAGSGSFRAVGKESRLVFDFPGVNRFALMDLMTGAWSEDTLRQTAADLAAALLLVDALGHAFMLARKSDTGGA